MIIYLISELLLYLSFAILAGTFIIAIVPNEKKPTISIHKRWLQLSILGIVLFSAMPVVQIVEYLYQGVGLSLTLTNVINNFEVGRAWTLILILSIFYYLLISVFPVQQKKSYAVLALVFLFILILAVGWASHAASLTEWSGFAFHTTHFTAVSVWIGVLFIVSWFSKDTKNWNALLKWYSPLAIVCFILTMISGFYMMSLVVDLTDYTNSWLLDYGQALLIKHLFIIPLLVFAFFNGMWMKCRLNQNPQFNPKPWVRGESLLLLFIFSATAFLGQSSPPHEIESTIKTNGVSALFQFFYGGTIAGVSQVQFSLTTFSFVFMLLAAIFLALLIYSFRKKAPAIFAFFMSFLSVLSIYLSFMTSF
ncbi:copper resistance D family protein (plasmid) [Alkalihalophilus sp. As8PL]|uniref:Copper resistance D family protein n=1 Tax=Alkalihalophilus sp. As8PL TaxID=3237103 RepID=A0AB39BNZ6_9BACI